MAILETNDRKVDNPSEISAILDNAGVLFRHYASAESLETKDANEVLEAFKPTIEELSREGGYINADIVELKPSTPGLDDICAKFVKEHHHNEDEVRLTVAGEGVFEILSADGTQNYKITTGEGDLIVIPANRRHLFYLTEKRNIRCIRLFQTKEGWEAIYDKSN